MTGQRKKAPRPDWQRSKKLVRFIAQLKQHGNVCKACKGAAVSRAWVYDKRDADEEFAEAFAHAKAIGLEALKDEAHRRAFEGVLEPLTYQGEVFDHVRKYSDVLLMFLIKQADPTYREHHQVDHTSGGRPFMFQMVLDPGAVAEQQGKT